MLGEVVEPHPATATSHKVMPSAERPRFGDLGGRDCGLWCFMA